MRAEVFKCWSNAKFVSIWNVAFQIVVESLNDLRELSGLIYLERPGTQSRSYSNFTQRWRKSRGHANLKNAAKTPQSDFKWSNHSHRLMFLSLPLLFRVAVKSRLKFLFEGFWVLWEHFTLAVYKQPWKYRNMHGRQAIFSHLRALWGLLHGLVSLVSKSFANRRTLLLDESSIIHQKPSTPWTIGQWHHQAIDWLLRGPCHRITWFRGQWLIFSVRATFNMNQ